ncbi:hypothetical protein GCM10027429_15690 [Marivirga atlantica]|uniref:DUF2231 domain-containing protein n=1 Tax=Marivirga atlantica TaxID=1548457 RepID=A0A937A7J3_9BACT|nr:hypothetical protein [Marivirga atlantica]MBL0765187.1 hypothetical protein [Marivirga atlantica]
MNEAHQHLLVNHLPIVSLIIGILVLAAGYISKKNDIKLTALGIFVLAAIFSIAAFYTGEGAEEVVEETLDVSHKIIHEHEEHAELFYTLSLVLGALSIITFWLQLKKKQMANAGYIIVLLFALVCLYFGAETGNSGGEIRHTEIRNE